MVGKRAPPASSSRCDAPQVVTITRYALSRSRGGTLGLPVAASREQMGSTSGSTSAAGRLCELSRSTRSCSELLTASESKEEEEGYTCGWGHAILETIGFWWIDQVRSTSGEMSVR